MADVDMNCASGDRTTIAVSRVRPGLIEISLETSNQDHFMAVHLTDDQIEALEDALRKLRGDTGGTDV